MPVAITLWYILVRMSMQLQLWRQDLAPTERPCLHNSLFRWRLSLLLESECMISGNTCSNMQVSSFSHPFVACQVSSLFGSSSEHASCVNSQDQYVLRNFVQYQHFSFHVIWMNWRKKNLVLRITSDCALTSEFSLWHMIQMSLHQSWFLFPFSSSQPVTNFWKSPRFRYKYRCNIIFREQNELVQKPIVGSVFPKHEVHLFVSFDVVCQQEIFQWVFAILVTNGNDFCAFWFWGRFCKAWLVTIVFSIKDPKGPHVKSYTLSECEKVPRVKGHIRVNRYWAPSGLMLQCTFKYGKEVRLSHAATVHFSITTGKIRLMILALLSQKRALYVTVIQMFTFDPEWYPFLSVALTLLQPLWPWRVLFSGELQRAYSGCSLEQVQWATGKKSPAGITLHFLVHSPRARFLVQMLGSIECQVSKNIQSLKKIKTTF